MLNQTVDIADLVNPKFRPGQLVYLVRTDTHGIESAKRVLIDEIRFIVSIKRTSNGTPHRSASLVYDLLNNGLSGEDHLFASLEDVARSAK